MIGKETLSKYPANIAFEGFTAPKILWMKEHEPELFEKIAKIMLPKDYLADVRIVTPGIPDKKLIYKVTRSYYAGLVRQGVRIFEYTPGFIHAKQCVCDGEAATCGTIRYGVVK